MCVLVVTVCVYLVKNKVHLLISFTGGISGLQSMMRQLQGAASNNLGHMMRSGK